MVSWIEISIQPRISRSLEQFFFSHYIPFTYNIVIDVDNIACNINTILQQKITMIIVLTRIRPNDYTLVTMLQLRPNCTELRSMDYYHQFFCRFRKCKRKVPPPSPLSNDFEKSWFFSKFLEMIFFQNWHFWTLDGIFEIKMMMKICLGVIRFGIGGLWKKLG